MPFNMAAAYVITFAAILFIFFAAAQNGRSRWRREREDTLLDIHLLWDKTQADMRGTSSNRIAVPALRHSEPLADATADLAALNAALSVFGNDYSVPTDAPISSKADTAERERLVSAF
jgi:hypothetical protein